MNRASLAIVSLALLSGCEKHSKDGNYFGTTERVGKAATTFYVNNYDEPEYIDPGLTAESAGSAIVQELFEGLVIKHPETVEPVQGVATHYEVSDDNRLFRFHLREQARWSDGRSVVAGDFVYAWQRVLDPATGARTAGIMHSLKNGKGFNTGRIKRLDRPERLRAAPASAEGESLARGTPLWVLATTPAKTSVAPLARAEGADLSFEGGALGGVTAETLEAAASLEIVAIGPPVSCNHEPDRWYEVRVGDKSGHLPGCAIAASGASDGMAVVSTAASYPSYGAPTATAEEAAEESVGFVPVSALVADPGLVGVRARGDHVLEIELEKPTPHFLEMLTYTAFSPVRKDVVEPWVEKGQPERWFRPENIVSNGPYVLSSHKFRYELVLRRNPHHYDHDALKIHEVVMVMVPSYHATMNLYKTGEIDFIGQNLSLPQAYMELLAQYGDFHRAWWIATYWYELNTEKPPLDDVRVRHALDLSIDKQQLIDKVTRAGQLPATHFVPPFTGSGYRDQVAREEREGGDRFRGPGHDFDPERARKLLEEAGYQVVRSGAGFRVPGFPDLEILYNTSEGHRALAVAIQDMWKRHLGVTVQLRNEEWKVMIKNLRDRQYQIARFGWVGDYNHPHSWLETFASDSHNNFTGYTDTSFDALLARAARTVDREESMRLYRDAETKLVDAMPRLPLYFYTKSTLMKPYVRGFWPNVANVNPIRFMWIDPDWKKGGDNRPAYPIRPLPEPGRFAAP